MLRPGASRAATGSEVIDLHLSCSLHDGWCCRVLQAVEGWLARNPPSQPHQHLGPAAVEVEAKHREMVKVRQRALEEGGEDV